MVFELEKGFVVDKLVREAYPDEERGLACVDGTIPLDEIVVVSCAMAESFSRPGERHAGEEKQVEWLLVEKEVVAPVWGVVRLSDLVLASRQQGVGLLFGADGEKVETGLLFRVFLHVAEGVQLLDPRKVDLFLLAETDVKDAVRVQLVHREVHVQPDGAGLLEGREVGDCGGGQGRLGLDLRNI